MDTNDKTSWWQGPRGEGYVVIQFALFGVIFFAPRTLPGWPAWAMPWSTIGIAFGLLLGGIIIGAFGWGFLQNGILTLGYALILFLFFDIKSRREEQ